MGDLEPPVPIYTTKRYLRYNKTLQNFLETPPKHRYAAFRDVINYHIIFSQNYASVIFTRLLGEFENVWRDENQHGGEREFAARLACCRGVIRN